MKTIVHRAPRAPVRAPTLLAIVAVALLLTIWILGMSHVIQLPLALVWIIPFLVIVAGAFAVLYEGGLFDGQ
jgi:hypothetical protein